MKSEIEPVHHLLSTLLAHPCRTRSDLVAWNEIAEKLDKAMSDSSDWMTGFEFHQIQHYIIDVKCGKEEGEYRHGQRDLMNEFLNRFMQRETAPEED